MKPTKRRISKRAIFFGLCLTGMGALGAAVAPQPKDLAPLWDNLSRALQTPLYEDQRRQLSLHMPGIFPVRFTCLYTPAKGEWRTVLPGDEVNSFLVEGKLACTNGEEFVLQPNTSVRIWARRGTQVHLEIRRGMVAGRMRKLPLRLTLGDDYVDLRPRTEGRFLASYGGEEGSYVKCLEGHAQVSLSRSMQKPLRLDSVDCRVDVVRAGEPQRFTIASGEEVFVSDLPVPIPGRPPMQALKRSKEVEAETLGKGPRASIALSATKSADGRRQLAATSAVPQDDCQLLSYQPGTEPKELKAYAKLDRQLVMDVPGGTRPPYFFACEESGVLHASNIISSLKAPAAATSVPPPAPAQPAPAPAAAPPLASAPAPKAAPAPASVAPQKAKPHAP